MRRGRGRPAWLAALLTAGVLACSTLSIPEERSLGEQVNEQVRRDVTLVITGGLRTESDFTKALALGADAVALANSALQAIGCLGDGEDVNR